MLNVSDKYIEAVVGDVRDMPYKVTLAGSIELTQDDIPNMTLTESVSGGSGIALGTSNSAQLNLTLRNPAATDYSGMLVEPKSGLVLDDGTIEWVPLGKFWVTKSETSNDYRTVKLTCADGMYRLSGEYVSELAYPADIRAVTREFVARTGIEFVEPDFWPDVVVRRKPEKMSARAVAGYLAGCMGCNARFNREGKLEFVWYTDSGITIDRTTQYMDGMTKLNDKPLKVSFEVTGEVEKYNITVNTGEHGTARATPSSNVLEGDTVTISVRPDSFYQMASITVAAASGVPVPLTTDVKGAGYTFVQPDSDVTITVAFTSEGLHELTVKQAETGNVRFVGSEYSEGAKYFAEGDFVTLLVTAREGFELDYFLPIPTDIEFDYIGDSEAGEAMYQFEMPDCDVTVTPVFKETASYKIEKIIDVSGLPSTPGGIKVENITAPGYSIYKAGDIISVRFARAVGYDFDHYESNVKMTQIDEDDFQFVMPSHDVTITAYFVAIENEENADLYSWLETPVAPPTPKPYWAVFYFDNWKVPTWKRFHLVWFDSWTATSKSIYIGAYSYAVHLKGVYYCSSKDTGFGEHFWDTDVWNGNGAGDLAWDVIPGMQNSGDTKYGFGSALRYCLLASNIHLVHNDETVFQSCPNAIMSPKATFYLDGVDVRERGTLRYWKCPDTISTPPPAANWLILSNGTTLRVLFYDDISIVSDGLYTPNELMYEPEEVYTATLTNGYSVHLVSNGSTWGTVYEVLPDTVFKLRSAKYGNTYFGEYDGILATSKTLYCGGYLLMYRNDARICDCMTGFALRSGNVPTDEVTLTYTNPMIYEKMVPAIQGLAQGITYTPAKVKHRGNPAFQAGDIVTVPDGDGVYHNVLIMQQTLNFGGGMNSDISCPGQTADTANFNANSPVNMQIKQEINRSQAELEHAMSVNNAAIFSALYKAFGSASESLQGQLNNLNERTIVLEEDMDDVFGLLLDGTAGQILRQSESGFPEWSDLPEGNYELPQAAADVLGGVKAVEKTTETVPVAIDENGQLFVPESSGGGGGINRTLLAQWGELTGGAGGTNISATTLIPWVAEEDFNTAMQKYKMFQFDIYCSITGFKFRSFVVGNPVYGFVSTAYHNCLKLPQMFDYNLIAYFENSAIETTGKRTFQLTPMSMAGAITTMSGVLGIAVYGIE